MADLNASNVRIQVLISEDTAVGKYQSAIYFTPSEYAALSADEVATVVSDRKDAWVSAVQAASSTPAPEPTAEELTAQADELQRQLDEVNARIAAANG